MVHEIRMGIGELAYCEPTSTHIYDLQLSKWTLLSSESWSACFHDHTFFTSIRRLAVDCRHHELKDL